MDTFEGIPAALASEIRQIQAAEVAGGRAYYEKTGSMMGRE